MLKKILAVIIILVSIEGQAQSHNYDIFDNYRLSVEAVSVRFFIQDNKGFMWIGTEKGLYSFDGYTAYPHFAMGDNANNTINCGMFISDSELLLGSENGFLLYNIRTLQYQSFLSDFHHDIRSLIKVGNDIWIGCFDGLFTYNTDSGELNELLSDNLKGTRHSMIYTLMEDNGYVYLGSNRKLGRFALKNMTYEELDTSGNGGNYLVHSLLKDSKRKCIWIGQGGRLFQYFPESGIYKNVGDFNVVKSMTIDENNNIIMGTDNGLVIYNDNNIRYVVHDSREQTSLANNVVWYVFKDKSENIWLGTDKGISFSPKDRRFNLIPIYTITGTGEGNQFHSIYRDAFNNFWLGGSNGLILCKDIRDFDVDLRWYKMGGSQNRISHNHIRDIFEDNDNNLWIATDYGLNKFNRHSQGFKRYTVYSPDGMLNANWAYDVLEDSFNRLWIASYNGGIFVIDKQKLVSDNMTQTADLHYSMENGLSGNNVDFIVLDKNENVWALIHNTAIEIINTKTGDISTFPIRKYTGDIIPSYLMTDNDGFIWAGYSNGIVRIDPLTQAVENVTFKRTTTAGVLAMAEVNNSIWISTSSGIWIVNKTDLSSHYISSIDHVFTSMYYDETHKEILLGGIDILATTEPNASLEIKPEEILISALYVNNQLYKDEETNASISETDKIRLSYNQNNIELEVTDLSYSKEGKGSFIYKMNDEDKWITLPVGANSIQLNKLDPGNYNLSISKNSLEDNGGQLLKTLSIVVAPPWYASMLAKLLYAMLLLLLIWWIYFFIKTKNRMKYVQVEKEKTLEQSRLKVAFFSDVAHEFKTPLSLIIAPLSGLIQGIKNEKDRHALEMINQNAMKLNSLIHQAIDYYRDDSKVNIGLLLSKVELVEFARSIFLSYKEGMKNKKIEFIFNTNVQQVFLNIDTVKMESVFNNLLSNACKFTNPGDSIIFSLDYQSREGLVEFKISDSGIGIPKQDIPYVFQRFFQSKKNTKKNEGTGIGLFLVKNYIELHGGNVSVSSKVNEGTTFTFGLPVISSDNEHKEAKINKINDIDNKQLIAIVEDNVAIAEFIYNVFTPEYRCIIAHNGKTGLNACMELNPDIIIADIMMPVMDGLEMARRLKNHIPTSTIPLVLLTAKDDKETELNSINLNVDAFIAKPFDSTILHSRVKQLLESRKKLVKKARIDNLSSPKKEKTESMDEKFLSKITKIIEDKIADPDLNVNLLSELADVNSKQLYRKVKQLTGLTTIDYIKSIRMKKAAMYLSNQNFTIAEVMYMVGFSNHSYFAKCFQSKFGVTPRQFTEQKKEA